MTLLSFFLKRRAVQIKRRTLIHIVIQPVRIQVVGRRPPLQVRFIVRIIVLIIILRNIDRKAFWTDLSCTLYRASPCHTPGVPSQKSGVLPGPSPGRFRLLQTPPEPSAPHTHESFRLAHPYVWNAALKHVVKSPHQRYFSVFHPVPEQPEQLFIQLDLRQTVK